MLLPTPPDFHAFLPLRLTARLTMPPPADLRACADDTRRRARRRWQVHMRVEARDGLARPMPYCAT